MTKPTVPPVSRHAAILAQIAEQLAIPVSCLSELPTPAMLRAIADLQAAVREATADPPAATDPLDVARAFLATPHVPRVDGRTLRRRYLSDRPLTATERNRLSRARKRGEVPTIEPKIYTQTDLDRAYQRGFEAGTKG